jgi:hypothetical protein
MIKISEDVLIFEVLAKTNFDTFSNLFGGCENHIYIIPNYFKVQWKLLYVITNNVIIRLM